MRTTAEQAYDELLGFARTQSVLASCADLLSWDEETFMPRGGVEHRGEQMATLAGLLHERQTSPRTSELLQVVEDSPLIADPDSPEAANVRGIRRQHDRQVRLPRRLIEEQARVVTVAQQVWAEAREESDYGRFEPWLARIIALARERSMALGDNGSIYDPLLDEHEPDVSTATVAAIFAQIRDATRPLLHAIADSPRKPKTGMLRREFPLDRQRLFAPAVAAAVGFDLESGRLDVGAHPFCVFIGPGDTRLVGRFAERNFCGGFFAMLHEVGHGLYDQGFAKEHYGTPLAQSPSLGMHESQSRLWENFVGRSLPFWTHFYPRLKNVFHEALSDVPIDDFLAAINAVQPSLIRPEADELTYNLHTLIRFELEQALLSGDVPTAELPAAWREAYRRELGIEPANDAEGCLQDGHWASGLFGYFPTYTLGNVYAAQLFAAFRDAVGAEEVDAGFAQGDFTVLLAWLREKIHGQGHRHSAGELVRRATGQPPHAEPLIARLRNNCAALYGV